MPYVIIPPTPIPNNVALPPVNSPSFAGLALQYVNFWVNTWVPAFNQNAADNHNNAMYVAEKAAQVEADTALAQAAVSALNAKLWVSGGSYVAATAGAPASVVVDPAKPSTTYRCIANVSGSATPPSADPTKWVELVSVPTAARADAVNLGNVSGAVTINAALGEAFRATITGNTTFSVINPPPAGKTGGFMLRLTNAGAFTVTFWSGIRRTSGYAPILTAAGTDVLSYWSDDAGATWHEAVQGMGIA